MLYREVLKDLFSDVRFSCFSLALILYALFSSPTPDNPGLLEVVVGCFLLLAVGIRLPLTVIVSSVSIATNRWRLGAVILFLYGLTIPLICAVINEASLIFIVRDVVGFLFLCLPLFIVSFLNVTEIRQKYFIYFIVGIGICFSLRTLFADIIYSGQDIKLLYLANSPLVLFACIYLLSMTGANSFKKISVRSLIKICFFFALFILTFMAMMVDLQRASILAIIISVTFLFILGFIKAPLRMGIPILFMGIIICAVFSDLTNIIENIEVKTSRVGLNMRHQELLAIWSAMNHSWFYILLGQGWGASFASPAVGELHVTYSHSLLTYSFFKMGVIGLFLTLIYLFFVFEKLVRLFLSDPMKANSFIWPLLIPILLYASHKSFDFGLLLTLILLSAGEVKQKPKMVI